MLANLPDDVREELENPEYITRKHYSRSTYALGCHGPMCRRAETLRGRDRNEARALDQGREYVPNPKIRLEDELLDRIIAEYLEDRELKAQAS